MLHYFLKFLAYNSSGVISKTVANFNGKNINLPNSKSNPCKASLYPKCPLIERQLYSFSRMYNLTNDVPKVSDRS